MKQYCIDTSGLSTPLQQLPEDIYPTLWEQVRYRIASGRIAVTEEIYAELELLSGQMGRCIQMHKQELLMKIGATGWDWESYVVQSNRMLAEHGAFISEYNKGLKGTVGIADMSIIALAKSLNVPLVSMETRIRAPGNDSQKRRRIPDICQVEDIQHLTFNDFLRIEGIKS